MVGSICLPNGFVEASGTGKTVWQAGHRAFLPAAESGTLSVLRQDLHSNSIVICLASQNLSVGKVLSKFGSF